MFPELSKIPTIWLRILTSFIYILLLVVNLVIFGQDNATVSDAYPTPITPASWTFSIWSVIFLLQLCGTVYILLPAHYVENGWKSKVVNVSAWGWIAGWVFESVWQYVFTRATKVGMVFALVVIIFATTVFLVTLFRLWNLGKDYGDQFQSLETILCFFFFFVPTSLNAAWLTPASSIQVLIVLVAFDVARTVLVILGIILAVIVTIGGVIWLYYRFEFVYALVLVWALAGIYTNAEDDVVKGFVLGGIVVLVIVFIVMLIKRILRSREKSDILLGKA